MSFGIDIRESEIRDWGYGILETLLMDHTTGQNIIWATNDYKAHGLGYSFNDTITPDLICDDHNYVIQPRISKSDEEQRKRISEKAEVFTPSWICNAQNNLIDKAWFETEQDIFNHETEQGGIHSWEMNNELPPYPPGKSWKTYIQENRLEMACGEAPYLCSRYDTTTGEFIPIERRIGLLDRKLMLINAHIPNVTPDMDSEERKRLQKQWRRKAYQALQSTYGFEWQGDNLLLAREALLITFIEYYQAKWHTDKLPQKNCLKKVAEIISWNIWQMDGLTYGIPGQKTTEVLNRQLALFDNNPFDNEPFDGEPTQKLCRIMEWEGIEPLRGKEVIFNELLTQTTNKH